MCRGLIIPIFEDAPGGAGLVAPQASLARAMEHAVEAGAWVINLSVGQSTLRAGMDPSLARAISLCDDRGVLLVAAAGNDGCVCEHHPAAHRSVLVVGSTGADGRPSVFSNHGEGYQDRGVTVPGEDRLVAVPGGGVARRSGTSFAAPLVAGLAGLLMSAMAGERIGAEDSGGAVQSQDLRDRVRAAMLGATGSCDLADASQCRRLLLGRLDPLVAFKRVTRNNKGASTMGEAATTINVDERRGAERAGIMSGVSAMCGGNPNCACGAGGPSATKAADNPTEKQSDDQDQVDEHGLGAAGAPVRLAVAASRPRVSRGASDARLGALSMRSMAARGVTASACNCGGAGSASEIGLAYALGELGYDFGTIARHDAIEAAMNNESFVTMESGRRLASRPEDLATFLSADSNAHLSASVIWLLKQDETPLFALHPEGAFARETFGAILGMFAEQIAGKSERLSVPGIVNGEVSLLSGQKVPVLIPELRGMANWTTEALVSAVVGAKPKAGAKKDEKEDRERRIDGVRGFLEKVYHESRNHGRTPQERALNYAATNAFNIEKVFESAAKQDLELDEIGVERSPICRQDSDCWDVRLVFFNPESVLTKARRAYRFTVDVSDVVPVLVGQPRSWSVR